MTWLLHDLPPAAMPANGKPGQGIADEAARVVVANWPVAEHRFVVTNVSRTWQMFADKAQACYVGAFRTPEREKTAYFSAFAAIPPLQLIIRKDTLNQLPLNADGEVLLPELLARTDLRALLVDQRSYGQQLDDMLAARPGAASAHLVSSTDSGKTIPRMLLAKRGDYAIEFDFVLGYQQVLSRPELDGLQSVPIAGMQKMLLSNFACPRTPWGREAILRIDQILAQTAGASPIRATVEKWLTPETRVRYRNELNAFALQRKKLTDASLYP